MRPVNTSIPKLFPLRRGRAAPSARLCDADIHAIVDAYYHHRARQVDLAARFDVSQILISKIVRRLRWGHVPWTRRRTRLSHHTGPLLEQDIRDIRTAYHQTRTRQKDLARAYNVTATTIGKIVRRELYKSVA